MIPIGAKVTATYYHDKCNGVLTYRDRHESDIDTGKYTLSFHNDAVKIRIDDPQPFTLWQYAALSDYDVGSSLFPMMAPISASAWRHYYFS